jgi:hypothetical protein
VSESESDSDADGHMQYNSSRDSSGRMGSQGDRKAAKGDSSKQTETFSLDADSVATLIVTVRALQYILSSTAATMHSVL